MDADVLASPQARTILYLGQPLADYELMYSPSVETEAMRHRRPDQIPVAVLRERFDWRLVPDATQGALQSFDDTDPKDHHVLAAAINAQVEFIVTANVRHFGENDMRRSDMSAVHPGLFLSHHLPLTTYIEVVTALCNARSRPPRQPLSVHETEVARHLPALFEAHRNAFGNPHPDPATMVPRIQFRGPRCVRCSRVTPNLLDNSGQCQECRLGS